MQLTIWIPVLVVTSVATVTDVMWRRIPNWLTLPLLAGGVGVNTAINGMAGLGYSLAGVGVAVVLVGGLCWLNSMGLGDLKLCAAIGAWIGASQLLFTLLITAMAGGIFAVLYALTKGQLGVALDRTGALLTEVPRRRTGDLAERGVNHPGVLSIPYAPAIATGVLISFLAS